jgi:hypothetical protein
MKVSYSHLALSLTCWLIVGCGGNSKSVEQQPTQTAVATPNDEKAARTLQPAEINAALQSGKEIKDVSGGGDFVVSGNKKFNGWFLKADRVIFESGATLTFSKQAQGLRPNFFIVTKELVVRDPNSPGKITWERGDVAIPPSASGQAANGPDGPGDNNAGGTGAGGAQGNHGYDGFAAPGLTLIVMSVPSSGPFVEFTGQEAGQGGQGQKGGTGGHGHAGNPASQSVFDCKRGGGNGGSGGTGGPGGTGGDGGTGGTGGTISIISRAELLPSLTQKFRVHIAGGRGGEPGPGGSGGDGGPGGAGGTDAQPHCNGGNGGPGGGTGAPGVAGKTGPNGNEGDFLVGSISPEQFKDYVWK